MTPADLALTVGATARLTKLVTSDYIGKWWLQDPAYEAAQRYADRTGHPPRWDRYRDGLSCPHCVSFHAAWIVLASHALFGETRLWRFGASALTISYVVGHVNAYLDASHRDDDQQPDDT